MHSFHTVQERGKKCRQQGSSVLRGADVNVSHETTNENVEHPHPTSSRVAMVRILTLSSCSCDVLWYALNFATSSVASCSTSKRNHQGTAAICGQIVATGARQNRRTSRVRVYRSSAILACCLPGEETGTPGCQMYRRICDDGADISMRTIRTHDALHPQHQESR